MKFETYRATRTSSFPLPAVRDKTSEQYLFFFDIVIFFMEKGTLSMNRIQEVALVLILTLVGVGGAFAQSNAVVDEILTQETITYGNAAYLMLRAQGMLDDDAEIAVAVSRYENGSAALGYDADQRITLGEFSYMTMKTFAIPGGFMYSILPLPRYAAQELVFRDIVQGDAYPRMDVSGERALRILGRVLALQESGRLR